MSEWIKCDDELPPQYIEVLVYGSKRLPYSVASMQETDQWGKPCWYTKTSSEECAIYPPKYWMPLPKSPI